MIVGLLKLLSTLHTHTTPLSVIIIPSRGFSSAFLSSESCRISDSVALSSGFLLSIQRNSLFVNTYSCTEYKPTDQVGHYTSYKLLVTMHTNLGDVIFYELLYLLCSNAVCGCLGNIVTHIAGELLWRDMSNNLMIC